MLLGGVAVSAIVTHRSSGPAKDNYYWFMRLAVPTLAVLKALGSDLGIPNALLHVIDSSVLACSGIVLGEVVLLKFRSISDAVTTESTQSQTQTNTLFTKPQDCLTIIDGNKMPDETINQMNKFEARAIPNQRLVTAFDIRNCFTTSERQECEDFRKIVEDKMYFPEAKWKELASTAKNIVKTELNRSTSELNLFEVVQSVTMQMVKIVFFDVSEKAVSGSSIRRLAQEINEQWLRSKDKTSLEQSTPPDWSFHKQQPLREALVAAFPEWNGAKDTNPLNLILPGYETLLRVVLRCFVEVSSRNHPNSPDWQSTLTNFLSNPTREVLEKTTESSIPSSSMIAKEALRLYPPTRRIYRHFKDKNGNEHEVAADVETMHRDTEIWGHDAKVFRPERWYDVDQKFEDVNWLPFGAKPFRCPAKRWQKEGILPFGVAMIALVTGALLEGGCVCAGCGFGDGDEPLETSRDAYRDVVLRPCEG
ncbi:putative cytochrome P450 CYP13A10 [Pseudocercospora fuligena]|uniref:Putative cytochrome P450 CYP13A10 n=1 Tax=Pseudocercospora fuligena TaxID=685502 RepID=A0A8H6RI84_9PEZI|nr:putative cytochrome P450 CYP13A10 [Pseudocercospora fuligena]